MIKKDKGYSSCRRHSHPCVVHRQINSHDRKPGFGHLIRNGFGILEAPRQPSAGNSVHFKKNTTIRNYFSWL